MMNRKSKKLLENLKGCQHESRSLMIEDGRFEVCWTCGSTRRMSLDWIHAGKSPMWEPWYQPHIWRNL